MDEIKQQENTGQKNSQVQEIQQWNEDAYNLHYLNLRSGATYAAKAYELSTGNSNSANTSMQGLADSLYNLSHFNMLLGNLRIAVEQAEESLQTYQKLEQEQPQADLYAHLGQLYQLLNQRNLAIDSLVKGLEITHKNHFELIEGKISLHIGSVYLGMGNYYLCIRTSTQAEEVFKKFKQPIFQAYALINLAQAYSHTQKIKEGLKAIQSAMDITKEIGSPVIAAEALYYRGMIHCLNGDIELATTDLLDSQQLNRKLHMKFLNLRVKLGLSDVFIISQDFQQANLLLGKCLKMAKTIGIEPLILESHQKLSAVYEKKEKYSLSLTHFKRYSELTNHLFTQQSLQKEQTIEVLYRTRSAAREVELTREKNQALEHEILERSNLEAELRKSEKRYRTMASFDPLTHLYNRRHFYNLAEIEFERAIRYKHPLTLLMIDLDHFKLVNDRYGHLVGDDLLEFVATICKRNLRKIDIIGRYGGEEFIVLLPETGAEHAFLLAKRICDTIRETRMPSPKGSIAITASIGVGEYSSRNESLESLIEKADQAMYMAKNNGRNQVCLAPSI